MDTPDSRPAVDSRPADPRPSLVPFVLTLALLAADQVTKAIVVARIPEGRVAWAWAGDFFWLVHARNLGVAFSLGATLGESIRRVIFIAIPLVLISGALVYYFRGKGLKPVHRWALAVLVAGGAGNLVDRIFRSEGVVDFLSFKFYGILGMERFPTFNVADMCIFCSAIFLGITGFLSETDGSATDGGAKK